MCFFTTIAATGVAATVFNVMSVLGSIAAVASTAIGTVSAVQSAKAQEAQYEYQAKVAKDNERTAEINAIEARQKGIEDARLKRMKTLQQVGALQTAQAANGVDISTGTSLDLIEDTKTMGELDAMNSIYDSERTARNYEIQAGNFANQSEMDLASAKNTSSAGKLNAFGTALEGIGKTSSLVADKWTTLVKDKK